MLSALALTTAAAGAALLTFAPFTRTQPSPNWVTITPTNDPDVFLAADYSDVYSYHRTTGAIDLFTMNGGSRRNVPTGLAYDRTTKRLFIANYRSNNVLVAHVHFDKKLIVVEEEFGHDVTLSPENVSVDEASGDVAVANYDGGDIQVWSRSPSGWGRTCSVPVQLAHGVHLAHGNLYATSLEARRLLKIDPVECRVTAQVGKVPWLRHKFLWPTHVARWGDAHVGVSDAHTGMLSIHRQDDLRLVSTFGGNGPSLLNMPYAFARTADGGALILSTFGQEIVQVPSWKLHLWTAVGFDVPPWSVADSSQARRWSSYRSADRSVSFIGRCVQEGYGGYHGCEEETFLRLPRVSDVYLSGGAHFYFSEISTVRGGWLLSSPQHPSLIYIRREDLRFALLPVGADAWQHETRVLTPSGPMTKEKVEATALQFLAEADQSIGSGSRTVAQVARFLSQTARQSPTHVDRAQSTLEPTSDNGELAASFDAQVHANLARAELDNFRTANERCSADGCDEARLCAVAQMAAEPLATRILSRRAGVAAPAANGAPPGYWQPSAEGDASRNEVDLGALLTAAMLNPCVGRALKERLAAR